MKLNNNTSSKIYIYLGWNKKAHKVIRYVRLQPSLYIMKVTSGFLLTMVSTASETLYGMMLSLFLIQWPPLSPILLALAQYSWRTSSTIPSQRGTAGNCNAIQDLESLKFVLKEFVLWLEAPLLTIWACRCRKNILIKGLLKQLMPLALPGSANYFFNNTQTNIAAA